MRQSAIGCGNCHTIGTLARTAAQMHLDVMSGYITVIPYWLLGSRAVVSLLLILQTRATASSPFATTKA